PDFVLTDLAGIGCERARLSIEGYAQEGPLLITHWGFSGPAALKLSAWAARYLHDSHYEVPLFVDWLPDLKKDVVLEILHRKRNESPKQTLSAHCPFALPKNLWKRLLHLAKIEETKRLGELGNEALAHFVTSLKADMYLVKGKTTHKEEFVTCGGISLAEVDF